MMSTPGVKAIRERAEKATPGPWKTWPSEDECSCQVVYAVDGTHYRIALLGGFDNQEADAVFIGHSREDVPALCDRIEVLEAENAALRARVEELERDKAHKASPDLLAMLPRESNAQPDLSDFDFEALYPRAASQGETDG